MYTAPIDQILKALQTVGLGELLDLPVFDGLDEATIADVIEGFGKLAADVIEPSDTIGDRVGATLDVATGKVSVADELVAAYSEYVKGNWISLSAPAELGGGGFPKAIAIVAHEMFGSANMALSLNPMLTQSGIELLEQWGDERQQRLYLSRLIDGTWTGTMNLTEPDAGSDLSAVRTVARPIGDAADGGEVGGVARYAISGTKIYITWGEHELTDNIVHLVLARTPDAPAGIKGISLFVVPKFNVGEDGELLERNGVQCLALEHKLGIHSSPTCVLQFDDAVGELIGSVGGGMAAMFSMMNPARLAVGVQGVSIAERSLQQSLAFAQERRQGRATDATSSSPIIEHPDVQRMLLEIAVGVDATRLLTYATAIAADLAKHHPDEEARISAKRRVDVLTPLAKAWPTDEGVRLASIALQVHGGMGFVEETGIAQRLRDVRIAPIYEGTNGIQAIDLVGRKVARDHGKAMYELLDEIADHAAASASAALQPVADAVRAACADAREATAWVAEHFAATPDEVLSGATAFLELVSLTYAGSLLLQHAERAGRAGRSDAGQATARAAFFARDRLHRRPPLSAITFGATNLRAALGAC